jgi:hypothetical protein
MKKNNAWVLTVLVTFSLPALLLLSDATTWPGLIQIWQSPSILVTDYFTVGGFSAAIANAWLTTGLSAMLLLAIKAPFNGVAIAGLFTIAGFAVFGKTPLNVLPIWMGITLYAYQTNTPRSQWTAAYLFGTAMGPIASYLWAVPPMALIPRMVLGVVGGVIAGYLIPPVSIRTPKLHLGYNLYNIGFTIGLIGTLFTVFIRWAGWNLSLSTPVDGSHTGGLTMLLLGLFGSMLILAQRVGVTKESLRGLIKDIGLGSDFVNHYGWGATLVNMALLGYLSVLLVWVLGFELHGPMVAGVLTVVGFGAFGKHILNVVPLMIGAALMGWSPWVDGQAVGPSIAILFVTALAPVSLKFGVVIAILVGMLHVFLGPYGLWMQGGFALYNNGFVAGFVAILVAQPLQQWSLKRPLKNKTS